MRIHTGCERLRHGHRLGVGVLLGDHVDDLAAIAAQQRMGHGLFTSGIAPVAVRIIPFPSVFQTAFVSVAGGGLTGEREAEMALLIGSQSEAGGLLEDAGFLAVVEYVDILGADGLAGGVGDAAGIHAGSIGEESGRIGARLESQSVIPHYPGVSIGLLAALHLYGKLRFVGGGVQHARVALFLDAEDGVLEGDHIGIRRAALAVLDMEVVFAGIPDGERTVCTVFRDLPIEPPVLEKRVGIRSFAVGHSHGNGQIAILGDDAALRLANDGELGSGMMAGGGDDLTHGIHRVDGVIADGGVIDHGADIVVHFGVLGLDGLAVLVPPDLIGLDAAGKARFQHARSVGMVLPVAGEGHEPEGLGVIDGGHIGGGGFAGLIVGGDAHIVADLGHVDGGTHVDLVVLIVDPAVGIASGAVRRLTGEGGFAGGLQVGVVGLLVDADLIGDLRKVRGGGFAGGVGDHAPVFSAGGGSVDARFGLLAIVRGPVQAPHFHALFAVPFIGIVPRAAGGRAGEMDRFVRVPGEAAAGGLLRDGKGRQIMGGRFKGGEVGDRAGERGKEPGGRVDLLRAGVAGVIFTGEGPDAGGEAAGLPGDLALVPAVARGGQGLLGL